MTLFTRLILLLLEFLKLSPSVEYTHPGILKPLIPCCVIPLEKLSSRVRFSEVADISCDGSPIRSLIRLSEVPGIVHQTNGKKPEIPQRSETRIITMGPQLSLGKSVCMFIPCSWLHRVGKKIISIWEGRFGFKSSHFWKNGFCMSGNAAISIIIRLAIRYSSFRNHVTKITGLKGKGFLNQIRINVFNFGDSSSGSGRRISIASHRRVIGVIIIGISVSDPVIRLVGDYSDALNLSINGKMSLIFPICGSR